MSKTPARLMVASNMRRVSEKAKKRIEDNRVFEEAEAAIQLKKQQEEAIRRTVPRLLTRYLESMHAEANKGHFQARLSINNRKHALVIMSNVATRLQEMGYRCSTIAGEVPGVGAFVGRGKEPISVSGYAMTVYWNEPSECVDKGILEDSVEDIW
jgi:hypothetical protein